MLFYAAVLGAIALAIMFGRHVAKEENSKGEGIAAGLTTFFVSGGLMLLLIFALGSATASSADRTLLSTKTYTVAEGSTFEDKYNEIRFIEQTEDKTLVQHRQDYSELKYETTNIKQVQVEEFGVNHYNIFPWGWGNAHIITLK